MIIIQSSSYNPPFNIAAEEYLFKHFNEDILFIYRNTPSIIVGKHQNAFSEINRSYCEKNEVAVVRRMSGGGAVYHDLGNLNFTKITTETGQNKVDFYKFLDPMLKFIKEMGVPVTTNKRHNIMVGDEKITGTACHTFKSRVMHHGTLLFSADLNALNTSLIPDNPNFNSKGVKSVPSKVTRLIEHLSEDISISEFEEYVLRKYVSDYGLKVITLNEEILSEINSLVKEKYSTWKWNYGYSPKFEFKGNVHGKDAWVKVEKGIIVESNVGELIGERFM